MKSNKKQVIKTRKKHLRIAGTDFAFDSVEPDFEPIAEDFIRTINAFKGKIGPHFKDLPRKIDVVFMKESFRSEIGGKWNKESIIHFSTEKFHEVEDACVSVAEIRTKFLYIFLHEITHFRHADEQAADREAKRILNSF